MADGAELILRGLQPAIGLATPVSAFMQGAQDQNTLANQLLNNQLLQQRASQEQLMNPLLIQEAQNKLALQGQDVTTGQMKLDQAKQGQLIRDMQSIATEALQMPGNARRQHILGRLKTVDFAGLDENELINEIGQLDDTQLEQSLRSMMTAADSDSDKTAEQKNRASLLRTIQPALDEEGNFDPSKANAEQKAAAGALGIYRLASKMTKDELEYTDQDFADYNTAKEIYRSAKTAEEKERAISRIQLKYGPDIAQEVARGTAQGKGEETRGQDLIDRGITAAESLATTKRALSLLNTIETGGIDKVRLAAKQFFGVESADEGELTYSLAKSVLKQLKETFGAQFTAAEGERLERIEASLGRGTESNKRILGQLQRMSERTAKRALRAAEDRGDFEAADDIREMMDFSLEIDEQPTKTATTTDRPVPGKKGGQIMTDANGNRAIVYPDGTFEEL